MDNKQDYKILNNNNLDELLNFLQSGNNRSYGKFKYKNFRILISSKEKLTSAERNKLLRNTRLLQGLCPKCGKKPTAKNPASGKLYKYCDYHREMDNTNKIKASKKSKSSLKKIKK